MGLISEHMDQMTEFERFMADEDRQREVEFHNSKLGKWWDSFLQRRYAKAVNRLRRLAKEDM